jgi:hypothetical protein
MLGDDLLDADAPDRHDWLKSIDGEFDSTKEIKKPGNQPGLFFSLLGYLPRSVSLMPPTAF